MYIVSQKKSYRHGLRFSEIFSQTVANFKSIFTHLLYVPINARLQMFYSIISYFNEVMAHSARQPRSHNNAQNVHHWPKTMHSYVCESR